MNPLLLIGICWLALCLGFVTCWSLLSYLAFRRAQRLNSTQPWWRATP